MSAWERLVRAALLGTERQAAPEDVTGDPAPDAAVAALADRTAEARLLGTAALLDAWRRAGRRPSPSDAPAPPPAPRAEERVCAPHAAAMLRQVLAGGPPPLVAEWLSLAQAAGVAVPHELLPPVLDFGARHAAVRDAIAAALGQRGRWLAAQNPEWGYAAGVPAGGDPAEGWETGTAEERVRILHLVRSADPAAGLALLRTTWATDAPRDRAAFVEALSIGLGMDDEPFLESLLDDKRKEVRTAAAGLLASLPGSRLVRRMTDRLVPLLTLRTPDGLLSRIRGDAARIEVQLPAECDRAMKRDGVEPKPIYGFGERAWWLHQMVAAVPPSFWTAHWGRSAADLLAAAAGGEEGDLLVRAWTEAAIRTRDAEWAEARLRTVAGLERVGIVQPMAAALPPERLEPLVLERLPAGRLTAANLATEMLQAARHGWSPALTRAVVALVPPEAGTADYSLRELLRGFALHMHPATAVATLREQGDRHEGKWVDLLHLRHTLHQAFQ